MMIWISVVVCVFLIAIGATIGWLWRRNMFRRELPRIYELRDGMRDPEVPRSYLKNLDISLAEMHGKLHHFRALESTLGDLDDTAWRHLKSEVAPLLIAQDQYRGWQSLFDILNHAKAYGYLKREGCTNIRFVAPSSSRRSRIADLEAERESKLVLCEVKTINASQDEVVRRRSGGVGSIGDRLSDMFFSKLTHDLLQARQQLTAQADGRPAELVVYVVIMLIPGGRLGRPVGQPVVPLRNWACLGGLP